LKSDNKKADLHYPPKAYNEITQENKRTKTAKKKIKIPQNTEIYTIQYNSKVKRYLSVIWFLYASFLLLVCHLTAINTVTRY